MSKKKKTNKKSTKSTLENPRYLRRRRVSPLKLLFWLTLVLMAGFVVFSMYRFFFDKSYNLPSSPSEIISSNNPNKTNSSSDKKTSSEEKPKEAEKEDNDNGKTIKQNEGEDPNSSTSITGSLTSTNKSGDKLILRANIDQYLSSGTCSLKLENSGNVVEKTADIFPTASTSSCNGFDIPLSELSSGTWSIIISLSSGDKVGEIKGEINL